MGQMNMNTLFHNVLIRTTVPLRIKLIRMIQERIGWNSDRIHEYQSTKLQELIHYCWEYVPYYRSKWKEVISAPDEIRTVEDLQKLPVLTKDELRNNLDALTTTDPHIKSEPARSGGSTGRPTLFRMTHDDAEMCWAQIYLGWMWGGYQIGEPFLIVGGESLGVGLGDRRTWKDWIINRWVTSGSNLTVERARALANSEFFRRIRFIYGYPNAIRELGELLVQIGAQLPQLRGVVCTAEVMRSEVRERISQIFGGAPVHDQYGLNDGGLLAVEGLEQDGLHVFFHRAILEVLDDENHQITAFERPGRAVATSLTNFATPFVRYETGDEVHWKTHEPAPSGIAWPRIGPVDGRTGDVIYLPSGRRIAMPGLTLVMRWVEGLHQYQFIQTGPKKVTARLDCGPAFHMTEDEVKNYLCQRIAEEVDWTIAWGPPELTQNSKLLIIRNDWLRSQGLTRPPNT